MHVRGPESPHCGVADKPIREDRCEQSGSTVELRRAVRHISENQRAGLLNGLERFVSLEHAV